MVGFFFGPSEPEKLGCSSQLELSLELRNSESSHLSWAWALFMVTNKHVESVFGQSTREASISSVARANRPDLDLGFLFAWLGPF